MKRSEESSSPNCLWRWKQAHVVSSRGTAYLWDEILQVNLKIREYKILSNENMGRKTYHRGVQDTLKSEHGKKDVSTPNVVLFSELLRNRELRMVQKILEICPSETHASGNREAQIKDLSTQALWIPDAKATMEKEWKEVIKKAQKKPRGKESPLCCIDGHSPHSKVRVHPGE